VRHVLARDSRFRQSVGFGAQSVNERVSRVEIRSNQDRSDSIRKILSRPGLRVFQLFFSLLTGFESSSGSPLDLGMPSCARSREPRCTPRRGLSTSAYSATAIRLSRPAPRPERPATNGPSSQWCRTPSTIAGFALHRSPKRELDPRMRS